MTRTRKAQPVAVHFSVATHQWKAHLFEVTLTIAAPADAQTLRLPAWIPGSYLIREFSKHLQNLRCSQGTRTLPVSQRDKATWEVQCTPGKPLTVRYAVYAFDNSVRTAWLDATRGFFNGTSLFLQVAGHETSEHQVDVQPPSADFGWKLATGLTAQRTDRNGFGTYSARNYDELVDCPVEMGPFWSGTFMAGGVPHQFVVSGAPDSFDGKKLLADTQAICEAEIRFWHGAQGGKKAVALPMKRYVFMLNAVHDSYGGLEHRNSTALICNRKDLPRSLPGGTGKQSEGYTTLLGLISHEYFHTWNVKQLRPAEFATYDYTRENYTELLWFFEGLTSYYDDLLVRRAGLIDNATYLRLLTKTINQVQQTPGRMVQSVAQASFDAWVKYYRQDENTANATVSYYTKGSLVGLCLDLTLRREGHTTLDAVMRDLWQRCKAGPMREEDLLASLQTLGRRSFAKELARWVHSTDELPFAELLDAHGVQVHREPDQLAQQLGLRVKESGGLHIQQVLRGGAAEQAGFAAGDEWLAVQSAAARASGPWRMQTLDDLLLYCGQAKKVVATVSRDKRLHQLPLNMPKPSQAVRLTARNAEAVTRWLTATP